MGLSHLRGLNKSWENRNTTEPNQLKLKEQQPIRLTDEPITNWCIKVPTLRSNHEPSSILSIIPSKIGLRFYQVSNTLKYHLNKHVNK